MPATDSAPIKEACLVCNEPVTILIQRDSGLALVDGHGYDGLTDSGDAVCRDHFCTHCGEHHTEAREFNDCAFYGRQPTLDLTPPCSYDHALAVVASWAQVPA